MLILRYKLFDSSSLDVGCMARTLARDPRDRAVIEKMKMMWVYAAEIPRSSSIAYNWMMWFQRAALAAVSMYRG